VTSKTGPTVTSWRIAHLIGAPGVPIDKGCCIPIKKVLVHVDDTPIPIARRGNHPPPCPAGFVGIGPGLNITGYAVASSPLAGRARASSRPV